MGGELGCCIAACVMACEQRNSPEERARERRREEKRREAERVERERRAALTPEERQLEDDKKALNNVKDMRFRIAFILTLVLVLPIDIAYQLKALNRWLSVSQKTATIVAWLSPFPIGLVLFGIAGICNVVSTRRFDAAHPATNENTVNNTQLAAGSLRTDERHEERLLKVVCLGPDGDSSEYENQASSADEHEERATPFIVEEPDERQQNQGEHSDSNIAAL